MARKALPSGSLDRLIGEVAVPRRQAVTKKRVGKSFRPKQGRIVIDPLLRFAEERGIELSGPAGAVRLAFQLAIELRDVAQAQRIGWLSALSRAVAEYVTRQDE